MSKKKRKEISGRDNWQSTSMARGMGAEYVFKTFFEGKFRSTAKRRLSKDDKVPS